MKRWYDKEHDMNMCEADCVDEWLWFIKAIGYDYDGCHSVEALKGLVDELVEMSEKARACLHDGHLFSNEHPMPDGWSVKAPKEDV